MLDVKKAVKRAKKAKKKKISSLVKKGMKKRVKERTWKQYKSKIHVLKKFAKEYTGEKRPAITKELFIRFVDAAVHQDWKSAQSYRYALRQLQKMEGQALWSEDQDLIDYCDGVTYDGGKKNKKERGAITSSMLKGLVHACKKRFSKPLISEAKIGWLARLRVSQVTRIKKGDWVEDEPGTYVLWLRKDKRCNLKKGKTRGKQQQMHEKPIGKEAFTLLEEEAKDNKKGQYVFPKEANDLALREMVKWGAKKLKWPSDLDFSGPHCLRHGGTAKLQGEARKLAEEWMAQATTGTVKMYGRSNRERKGKEKKNRKKRTKKEKKNKKKGK